MLNYTL